jgi:predicted unusual protein kinase regulating ubiquinone biosynthesis (AarF/ABC1/UbiB family)
VHRVLVRELGSDWRDQFRDFDDTPAAAASIGQVHRAVWADGRDVAVKVQYPGAGDALLSDLTQIGRMSRLVGMLVPGLEVKPLVAELKARVAEELDYELEAESQAAFASAYEDDPDFVVPGVVAGTKQVLVSEWVEGVPLSRIIAGGSEPDRDRAGLLLARFLFSGPARAGLLHADPHPGNFRLADDGRLVVLDYGAVNRLPDGLPAPIGPLLRLAVAGDAEGVYAGLQDEGFVRPGVGLDAERLLGYLAPILEPVRAEEFRFSRSWLRSQAVRVGDPRSPAYSTGLKLNLPPEYLLIHRVTAGAIGVLCQLEAAGPWRAELERWLPGFPEPRRPRNRRK